MPTLNDIIYRLEGKKADYSHYNFTQSGSNAFMAFFDLAQEFDDIKDFYLLCVAIPKSFFDLAARLYIIEPRSSELSLAAKTDGAKYEIGAPPVGDIRPGDNPYYAGNSFVLTIRGKKSLIDQLPFKTENDVLGLLEIFPINERNPQTELFFEKYANRIGFNIHNRFLVEKNIEHLKFIRTLVADIEHNIIAPNMIYRLYLNHLRKKIKKNIEIEERFLRYVEGETEGMSIDSMLSDLGEVNLGLMEELENIEKHYHNMSLFLETLFRREHFDKGRLTLIKKSCNMKKDVVEPQLERYAQQFRDQKILIDDRLSGIPDEEVISVVDIGLMSQVFANLFSNALKYTQEIGYEHGERKKYISYGREIVKDCFGPERDGIKYNVYSTGLHIPPEERGRIFEDDYRGSNALGKPGTGHGLSFIRNAVELHGGIVGYEPTQYGNNFYFILPK